MREGIQRAGISIAGGDPGLKVYLEGTQRICAPCETLARVKPHMRAMGITRIANVTGLDRIGVPVVTVMRPNARSLAVTQGKGLDLDAAKASGLMEAVEAYHAEHIELPLKLGSAADLGLRHRLAAFEHLPQIRGERFRLELAMLWIESVDLFSGEPILLPFETAHANFTLPLPPGSGCFVCSTNGLASGNHMLEAICHGICEVIERDATALWHRLPPATQEMRRLDLATVDDRACADLIDRIEEAGLSVGLWDTTTDTCVPSFACLLSETSQESPHIGVGYGCHPTRAVALLRALTEAVQVRMTYVSGARDDLSHAEFSAAILTERQAGARRMVGDGAGPRDYRQVPSFAGDTLAEDLEWLLTRLEAIGIAEVLAVDLTRSGLDIPVARIVIPGLEGPDDDDDFVPGPRASDPEAHMP